MHCAHYNECMKINVQHAHVSILHVSRNGRSHTSPNVVGKTVKGCTTTQALVAF